MRSNYTFALTALIALTSISALAQPAEDDLPDSRREEIRAQKAAYLTSKISLTADEAQRFWPIQNELEQELGENRERKRSERKAIGKVEEEMTEIQASRLIDLEMDFRQRELDIRKKYNSRFKESIGAKRTALLYRAEHDFHRELLKRFRDRGPRGEEDRTPGQRGK